MWHSFYWNNHTWFHIVISRLSSHLGMMIIIIWIYDDNHHYHYQETDPSHNHWLYMIMLFLLQLTQLSSQLSTKISTIKYFQINYIYIQRKSHNVCYIQSCYIADTCTERVTHFGLSSCRHMHARMACLLFYFVLKFH